MSKQLISILKDNRSSACYVPPEEQMHWWREDSLNLNDQLPFPPETDWQKEVYKIFTGKEIL